MSEKPTAFKGHFKPIFDDLVILKKTVPSYL